LKKSLYILFLLTLTFASSVSAHTYLESSSPSDGETVTEDRQEIVLKFETPIEKSSSFTLLSEGGEELPVQDIQVNGDTLSGKAAEPLGNGNYTVKWSIIGEDGHLINGEYVFTVAKESAAEENAEPSNEPEEEGRESGSGGPL